MCRRWRCRAAWHLNRVSKHAIALAISIAILGLFLSFLAPSMAQLGLSASATLLSLNRLSGGGKKWDKLVPRYGRRFGTNLSMSWSPRKDGFRFFASGEAGMTGGAEDTSQSMQPPGTYAWSDNKKPRVCILGGGFGGLYTALRLESLVWPEDKKPQVLLVDQSERFVFKPMLYELLSEEVDAWEIAPRFSDLLANTGIQFFQDKAKLLQPTDHLIINGPVKSSNGGTVLLESGLIIEYDWLVLALGSEAKLDVVPGALEFALPFSTLEDALKVDRELRALERKKFGKNSLVRVAVVGCGYAGAELAATVAERLQDKGTVQAINVETTILPTAPPGNREAALKVLSSRKVQLLLGYFVCSIQRVGYFQATGLGGNTAPLDPTEHEPGHYMLELQPAVEGSQGQTITADLVLWTVGSKPLLPELEPKDKPCEITMNARGQALTDETLRVKGHPRIFALGDSSSLRDSEGRLLPATAQVALQQADFAGWNLWAAINNRPLLPFRFQNLGEMMTLGRNDAALSPSFIEGLTLDGPIGHAARKLAYLYRLPTDEHRLKVGLSWFIKSSIDSVALVQSSIAKVLSGS